MTDGGSRPAARAARERREHATHEGDWLADAVLKPLTDLDGQGHRHVRQRRRQARWSMLAHPQQPLLRLGRRGARAAGRSSQRRGRAGADARRLADAR
ncbi:MAG: hypothetical protein MZW92_63095 [Comamonadaceae bacterium]|nr:hypothetical protein [Comamonadaceae bacterium]